MLLLIDVCVSINVIGDIFVWNCEEDNYNSVWIIYIEK